MQLITVDDSNTLHCWNINDQQLISSISFGHPSSFTITYLLHPATYINKILLASSQGSLQLWNISKQKSIYLYNMFKCRITCLVQTPALHVVAIGYESGLIVLHHLQQDISLMKFNQEFGPVNSIAFRTDDAATKSLMVSSSHQSGHLAIWNLDQNRLEEQMRNLHWQSIVAVSFISKQPLMITNSTDNSLKVFVFDDLETVGRLLFCRQGHRAPITKIKFDGDKDKFIFTSSMDCTMRSFSIYSERLNRSLGLAAFNRKAAKRKSENKNNNLTLMPIIDFAMENVRSKEWDNIVACHRTTAFVTTWNSDRMKMGQHKLLHMRFKTNNMNINVQAESVAISTCGNFVLIGYNTGHLDRFNIQSGLHRCEYQLNNNKPAHQGSVRAVVCDAFNQMVISGGTDQLCRVWRFSPINQNHLIGSLKLTAPVNKLCIHQENQFVAIALDNFAVIVMDLETKKIVRTFSEPGNRITDLLFDNSCTKLFASCMDSLIYIWDMLSARLVNVLATITPCISLSLSGSGEFLATAHVNDAAIYLWSNISIYSKVSLKPISIEEIRCVKPLDLPTVKSDEINMFTLTDNDEYVNNDDEENVTVDTIEYEYKSPEQISKQLITLSKLSKQHWKNLLKLDLIRKRNKPKQLLQTANSLPFFLPSIPGLEPKFDLSKSNENELKVTSKMVSNNNDNEHVPSFIPLFARSLQEHYEQQNLSHFFKQLKCMNLSRIDAEIRSIGFDCTGTIDYLIYFLHLIMFVFQSNVDFELVNSYLALFVTIHIDTIRNKPQLRKMLTEIAEKLETTWQRLECSFDRSICLNQFLRNAII